MIVLLETSVPENIEQIKDSEVVDTINLRYYK